MARLVLGELPQIMMDMCLAEFWMCICLFQFPLLVSHVLVSRITMTGRTSKHRATWKWAPLACPALQIDSSTKTLAGLDPACWNEMCGAPPPDQFVGHAFIHSVIHSIRICDDDDDDDDDDDQTTR